VAYEVADGSTVRGKRRWWRIMVIACVLWLIVEQFLPPPGGTARIDGNGSSCVLHIIVLYIIVLCIIVLFSVVLYISSCVLYYRAMYIMVLSIIVPSSC
jgi:hypothetical protein